MQLLKYEAKGKEQKQNLMNLESTLYKHIESNTTPVFASDIYWVLIVLEGLFLGFYLHSLAKETLFCHHHERILAKSKDNI